MRVYYCTRFSQQEVGKFIHIHTHTSIGKCTIKTTNQQQHVACVVKVVFYYKTFFWWCTEYTRANPFLTPGSSIECPSIKKTLYPPSEKKSRSFRELFLSSSPLSYGPLSFSMSVKKKKWTKKSQKRRDQRVNGFAKSA